MRGDRHDASWSTPGFIMTQLSKVPLILLTPKVTVLQTSISGFGTRRMMRSSRKHNSCAESYSRSIISRTLAVWPSGAMFVGLSCMARPRRRAMLRKVVTMTVSVLYYASIILLYRPWAFLFLDDASTSPFRISNLAPSHNVLIRVKLSG